MTWFAVELYGPLESQRQGNAREPSNAKANIRTIPVPMHLRGQQTLYADVYFWHERPYFITIAKPICLLITRNVPLYAMNVKGYEQALVWAMKHIRSRGYEFDFVYCDADKLLAPLVESVPELITCEAGAKVGDIEVEIKLLEEMLRNTQASLPVPVLMTTVDWLVRRCTVNRNLIVRPGFTLTPREIFTGRRVSQKQKLRLDFYDYVQVYRKPSKKNGPEPRTAAALAMMPMYNGRGANYYFDLTT